MSRSWTIVCIGILFLSLLMTPCEVLAGTDDSGLQVFTLNGADMMGETADVAQEDTKISQYSLNMFNSGNGLTTFPQPKGTGYEWLASINGGGIDCAKPKTFAFNSGLLVRANNAGGTAEVYYHVIPAYSSPTDVRIELGANASNTSNSDMFAFLYGGTEAVFLGNKILALSGSTFSPTTTEVVLTSLSLSTYPCKSAAIWQNRLFLSYSNYLFYSASQDFTNFTNSAAAGGTTRLYECTQIDKIIGTKYGLYMFTPQGIYIQTGTGAKGTWNIEKISDKVLIDRDAVAVYDDVIYFSDNSGQGKKIWALASTQLSLFAEIPYAVTSATLAHQMGFANSGRLLILATPTVGGEAFVYDTKAKSWFRSNEYNGLGGNYEFIKTTATGYKLYKLPIAEKFLNELNLDSAYLTPLTWTYLTSWFTLDGNASNRKEIDRIEFDYQGGTSAVSLVASYGNGSTASTGTFLYAPTNFRMNTYVWNSPIGKQQSNRFYLQFQSYGTQTMTTNHIVKQIRIYYRNIGNYKTNTLR